VKAFSGATGATLLSFFAYEGAFTGGVRVAAGEYNGNSRADIVTGPGRLRPPTVRVFNGDNAQQLQTFAAYAPAFTGGVYVAGNLLATGPGGSPPPPAARFAGASENASTDARAARIAAVLAAEETDCGCGSFLNGGEEGAQPLTAAPSFPKPHSAADRVLAKAPTPELSIGPVNNLQHRDDFDGLSLLDSLYGEWGECGPGSDLSEPAIV
jgi:hypothetical protein